MFFRTLVFFSLIISTCKGLLFNVSRGAPNASWLDIFSNLDPSSKCPNQRPNLDAGKSWCRARNAYCSAQGCCMCKCQYSSATFQMKVDPHQATCVRNSDIRSFAGCSKLFASEANAHPLATLDLSASSSKGIPYLPDKPYNCKVKSAEYLDITWKPLPKKEADTFSLKRTSSWYKNELSWTGQLSSSYYGYIMKVNGECKKGRDVKRGCVVFKTKGTLSWTIPDPSTQAPPIALSTTVKPPTTMTTKKVTTITKLMTHVTSATTLTSTTMYVKLTTKRTSTSAVAKTASSTKASSSKQTTPKSTSGPSVTSQETSSTASNIFTDHSIKPSSRPESTESNMEGSTTIEPTYHSVGSKEPKKGENKFSGQKEEEQDSMLVAIVVGVAAVICAAIVLLCVWLIVSQRRKHRNVANYGAGTTVIANPTTGSQNHFPMTGLLKNPVCDDLVYAEPVDSVHKPSTGLIGNPSYNTCEDLLLKNPGAKDSQSTPLNNVQKKPLNTASRNISAKENIYDCANVRPHHRGKPDGDKADYQSLIEENVNASFGTDLNVNTYQSLNPDGLMYQPLLKNAVHKRQVEIPQYLALLNPDDTSAKISPSTPEYQPPYSTGPPPADVEESPEYADYADLDELEEISASEASNKSSNEGQCYSVPLYKVLEGPSYDYASAPMYDVLEGPDPESYGTTNLGFEPPVYAVLEGPDSD